MIMNSPSWIAALLAAVGAAGAGFGGEPPPPPAPKNDDRQAERAAMVAQVRRYGITNAAVIAAMARVRRHCFIPERCRGFDDYADCPSPIGYGQTISQPYIVAYMTERLAVRPGMKVLEIGTGSGYQAAILTALGARVWTIEIVPELGAHARAALDAEGFTNVATRVGDGYTGWPEQAPFERIILTAAAHDVPPLLGRQLAPGGLMVLPIDDGTGHQRLWRVRRTDEGFDTDDLGEIRFVPLIAEPGPG